MFKTTVKRSVFTAILIAVLISVAAFASDNTVGLLRYAAESQTGYTIFNPDAGTNAYLIDNYGRLVHQWTTTRIPALSMYLLPNGDLLRTTKFTPSSVGFQQIDWDNNVVWEYRYDSNLGRAHHDIEPLPNGNVLVLAREVRLSEECIQAGRDPDQLPEGQLNPEHIAEIHMTGPNTGEVVWIWYAWDHMIQDFDSTKDNYGVVEDHPELMDINYFTSPGKVWLHGNGIAYNAELDQIIISCRNADEFWVIDHSTTTEEAAGHTGGNRGNGGDILYRWGNPQAYSHGGPEDQQLFGQHNAHWIPPGLPGEGHVLVFNNGRRELGRDWSSVDEIIPPTDGNGNYIRTPGEAFGPSAPTWSYTADSLQSFSADNISGAERLPNGNTLICSGPQGWFFEVTTAKDIVWEYINPMTAAGPLAQGSSPAGNDVFRCTRYVPSYSGFAGRILEADQTLELNPVEIGGTVQIPEAPYANQKVSITSTIVADSGVASVSLFVDEGAGYVQYAMLDDGHHDDGVNNDNIFGAIFNGFPGGTSVSYYVQADDDSGNVTMDPTIAPEAVYTFTVNTEELLVGDANGSGEIDIDDAVFLIAYIFAGGPAPDPIDLGDADCNGYIDIDDAVYLISYIFAGGPAPCSGV